MQEREESPLSAVSPHEEDRLVACGGVPQTAPSTSKTAVEGCMRGGRCGFYGNVVLVCAGCVILVALPGQSFCLGMFLDDMLQDLGISRSDVSWTWMVALLVSSCFLPAAGYIFDRYGAKLLLLLNIIPLVLSTSLVSRTTGIWSLGACFCGMRLFGPEVCELLAYCVVNMWFVQNRARASSILMTVDSSLLATPPILRGLRNVVGWRSSFVVLGALQGVILVMCWILMVNRPEDIGAQPDGLSQAASVGNVVAPLDVGEGSAAVKTPPVSKTASPCKLQGEEQDTTAFAEQPGCVPEEEEDWPFREIVRERSFCMLIVCFGLYRIFRAGMNMHIVNVFQEKGSNPDTASWVYSVITAGSILATLTFPKVCHWFENKIRLMGFVYCLGAAAMGSAGLMGPSNHWLVCWVFAALYGIFWGVVGTISGTIFADLFGRSSLGMTRSTLSGVSTVASGCGALVFSFARDYLGNYDVAIMPLAGTVCLIAFALLHMGHPQRPSLIRKSPSSGDVFYSVIGKRVSDLYEDQEPDAERPVDKQVSDLYEYHGRCSNPKVLPRSATL